MFFYVMNIFNYLSVNTCRFIILINLKVISYTVLLHRELKTVIYRCAEMTPEFYISVWCIKSSAFELLQVIWCDKRWTSQYLKSKVLFLLSNRKTSTFPHVDTIQLKRGKKELQWFGMYKLQMLVCSWCRLV